MPANPPSCPAPPARPDGHRTEGQTPRGRRSRGGSSAVPDGGCRSRLGYRWLLEGLRWSRCWVGGRLNGVVGVHPLGAMAKERGGVGRGCQQHPGKPRRVCGGTNKDSPERQLSESLRPQPGAKAAGTESELFAEVFHQINGIVLCWSSPICALSAPRQLCLKSDIQA